MSYLPTLFPPLSFASLLVTNPVSKPAHRVGRNDSSVVVVFGGISRILLTQLFRRYRTPVRIDNYVTVHFPSSLLPQSACPLARACCRRPRPHSIYPSLNESMAAAEMPL
ncbi:hypothetical protein F4808DRAFT_423707, partial [Astrocystis sublimbata]